MWFCLAHHSPFLPKPRVCLGPCPIGGVCRFRGWRWLRDRGALHRTVVDCAPAFTFLVTEINCAPVASCLSEWIYYGSNQDNSQTDILMQHPDPPPLDIHMTPPDDPPGPCSERPHSFQHHPSLISEQCFVLHVWGPNCSQRSSSKEGSQTSPSDAPPMLWPHSRRTCTGVSWLVIRFGCPKGLPGA